MLPCKNVELKQKRQGLGAQYAEGAGVQGCVWGKGRAEGRRLMAGQ